LVKRGRKKPRTNRTAFWVVTLLVFGALLTGWRLWSCLYDVSPQFNFIQIIKDDHPLKLLKGETLRLHPQSEIKIQDISTNICFNHGIRLVSKGMDVNALIYEKIMLSSLLPNRDIFTKYTFRWELKHYNQDIGYVNIVVEPYVEDWLDKVDRSIGSEQKVAVLERALKLIPDDKQIRDRLIGEYRSLKRWQQAALMLEDMAEESPDQTVLYDLLEVYEAMPETDRIISVLRRLIKMKPDDADVRLRLASILEKTGRLKEAIIEYEWLLKRPAKGDILPVYKTLGFLYTNTDQPQKAISTYLKAVELDRGDVNLYYNLSFLYEKIGRKDKADHFLSEAVKLKSGDTDSRLRLSERLFEKGRLKEAKKHLTEVLSISPNSMKALLLMVDIAEKRGDKKDLKKYFHKILSLDPQNKTVIYNLGVLEYETGNLAKALPYFKELIKSDPKDSELHGFLFDIYRRQNKDNLAYKEARTLMRLRPKDIGYYHYIFEYLDNRGDYKGMIEVMKDGLKLHSGNTDLRGFLILAYLKTGKEDLAVKQIEELLKLKPKDITLLLQLAKLHEKQGRFKESLGPYKKVMDISPGHEGAKEAYLRSLMQFAKLEEEQGRLKEALEAYKEVMDISPGHEEAEEAYLRLRFKVLPGETKQ